MFMESRIDKDKLKKFTNYLNYLELNIKKLMHLDKVLITILIHIDLVIQNMLLMKKFCK